MKDSREIAEFHSERFVPVLPDECQVNPQVYGMELAFWLCSELAQCGIVTSYPESEDWGWYIEYNADSGAEFAVDCGNVGGASDHWLLCLRRFGRRLFGRDKPPFSDATPLISRTRKILETESSVSNLEWRYPETAND